MKVVISLILLNIILNIVGQILFKIGMNQIGLFSFTWGNILPIGWKLMTNLSLMSGLFIYLVSTIIWFLVLSRSQVSFAYPLLSMGYILNAFAAYYFLHEQALTPMRIAGTLVIILGVVLICQT